MNRFLKSKRDKAKEAKETRTVKALDEIRVDQPIRSEKPLERHQTPDPEQKFEFDFSSALPSNDDFRTSLLMPKLSARFSMLKEQDDPESILGKASDDSVLAPKRASKLNVLTRKSSLLSDIDEVSTDGSRQSLRAGRAGSYTSGGDGYGTDDDRLYDGAIMNRPRRGEANSLFGGRQKVYKIPVKPDSASVCLETGRSMSHRTVNEDDVTLSPFQRLRLREKEDHIAENSALGMPAMEPDNVVSQFSSVRRTTQSTNSGPGNGPVSIPTTSVDELHPHGASHVHATGDATGVTIKPASVTSERGSVRSRRLYGEGLAQAAQSQQVSTLHRLESLGRQRAGAPEYLHLNKNYSKGAVSLRDKLQKLTIDEPATAQVPASPSPSVASPNRLAIENGSKAQGLHSVQARPIPPLTPPVSENEEGILATAVQAKDRGKATAMGLFNKPVSHFDEQQFTRRQLQMHEGKSMSPVSQQKSGRASQYTVDRPRALSSASFRSRVESISTQYTLPQRAADSSSIPSAEPSPSILGGTFFADSRSSESGDEADQRRSVSASSYSSHAFDNVHPAFRSRTPSKPSTPTGEFQNPILEVRYSDLSDLQPIEENDSVEHSGISSGNARFPETPDSPTLGPAGLGLSGLVHALRRDCNKFPMQQEALDVVDYVYENLDDTTSRPSTGSYQQRCLSGNWDVQSAIRPSTAGENRTSYSFDNQDELRGNRSRRSSTATQREREEFENELAERRRKVQEKLKSFAESESRAGSPVPGVNAFAILRNKSHRPMGAGVFGLGNASTPTLGMSQAREEGERLPHSFGRRPNVSTSHVSAERPVRSILPAIGRSSQDGSREPSRSRGASPHSVLRLLRERSGSDNSSRSKSRGRHSDRDELGPLEEGSVASHESFTPLEHPEHRNTPSAPASVQSSARPSVEVNGPVHDRIMSAAGRHRSDSQPGTLSHYDPTPNQQHPPRDPTAGAAQRSSPTAPYSANTTPPLYETPRPQPPGQTPSHVASPPMTQWAAGHVGPQKRVINKHQISEPVFVSSTSSVPTVGLPPGACLNNGAEAPPIPPMNPRRRRQTTAQTLIGALRGDRPELDHPALSGQPESTSDGVEKAPKPKSRLRKSSSEGGQMNTRARHYETPLLPISSCPVHIPMEGGMI